ncbi:MAG: S1C family serine protease [Actinomycetota bacterium]
MRVTLPDKRSFEAKVVGRDPVGDIALIRIEGGGELPQIALGDSQALHIGQTVIAIGNPLGLENTVTQGVLCAEGRELPGDRIQNIPLEDLLQTDAAINPGNSGGPLLDAYGAAIGMNTAIISQAQGIGFAVAADTIRRSVADLLEHGRVIRPAIGVLLVELTPPIARELGIPRQEGVAIFRVASGGPADRAGLKSGDVITEAAGQPVTGVDQLRQVLRQMKPGAKLTLRGVRGNSQKTWQVTVGELPAANEFGR